MKNNKDLTQRNLLARKSDVRYFLIAEAQYDMIY